MPEGGEGRAGRGSEFFWHARSCTYGRPLDAGCVVPSIVTVPEAAKFLSPLALVKPEIEMVVGVRVVWNG
jgi:hypothetical protein